MEINSLLTNQRYLFHYTKGYTKCGSTFRANFIKLSKNGKYRNLMVNGYHSKKYQHENIKTVWSIDVNLITKVEALPKILQNKCVLPDDILLEIDNYY
jgi:hypothetical protein